MQIQYVLRKEIVQETKRKSIFKTVKVLQQRFVEPCSKGFFGGTTYRWTEWQDVPTVDEEIEGDSNG